MCCRTACSYRSALLCRKTRCRWVGVFANLHENLPLGMCPQLTEKCRPLPPVLQQRAVEVANIINQVIYIFMLSICTILLDFLSLPYLIALFFSVRRGWRNRWCHCLTKKRLALASLSVKTKPRSWRHLPTSTTPCKLPADQCNAGSKRKAPCWIATRCTLR
jgi:hypothetical protein